MATWSVHAGEVEDDPSRIFLYFQNGSRALSTDDMSAQNVQLSHSLSTLAGALTSDLTPHSSADCQRYVHLTAALLNDLSLRIGMYKASGPLLSQKDSQFLNNIRIRLMIPAFMGLNNLIKKGREGGYSPLDSHFDIACSFGDREWLTSQMDEISQKLIGFHSQQLGNPGLLPLDRLRARLLLLSARLQHRRRMASVGVLIGATAVSLVFWNVAPVTVAVAARALGIPALLTRPAFVYIVRSVALSGEAIGYDRLDTKISGPSFTKPEVQLISWRDQMDQIQDLVNSSLWAADLYWTYMNQVELQLAAMFHSWFKQHQYLELTLHENSEFMFNRMFGLVHEMSAIGDASAAEGLERMTEMLHRTYGYDVSCNWGWWGVSNEYCLAGEQQLARSIYDDSLPVQKGTAATQFHIVMTSKHDISTEEDNNGFTVEIPYNADKKMVTLALSNLWATNGFQKRVANAALFANAVENFIDFTKMPIEFEKSLTPAQKWGALNNLIALYSENKDVFADTESLFVSDVLWRAYEVHMSLRTNIDAEASLGEMRAFFTQTKPMAQRRREAIQGQRQSIEDISAAMSDRSKVACSREGSMTTAECVRGLKRLEAFTSLYADFKPKKIDGIIVTGETEYPYPFDVIQTDNGAILVLRANFDFADFYNFAQGKAWLK